MGKLGGIILCGGQSRRMGRSKAWLRFGSEVMLQRVARLLADVASPIVIVAAPDQDLPDLSENHVVVRDPVSNRGPLQGLAAGFAALPENVELVYATATDAPFLHPPWVTRLAGLIGDHDVAIPEIGGFLHPLAALYRRKTVLPVVESMLTADRLRLLSILDHLRVIRLDGDLMMGVDSDLMTLRNLNTFEDYRRAHIDAGYSMKEEDGSDSCRSSDA